MRIHRDFLLPCWDSQAAARCLEYLRERGFANARVLLVEGNIVIEGTRGSWAGNLFSFDMTKLRAKVRIIMESGGKASVDLGINTFGQQITEWNMAIWRLEQVELRRVLLGLGRIDHVWHRFGPESRAAAVRWTATATVRGKKLTPEWEAEIRSLESERDGLALGAA